MGWIQDPQIKLGIAVNEWNGCKDTVSSAIPSSYRKSGWSTELANIDII